jgi:hypothetical protein
MRDTDDKIACDVLRELAPLSPRKLMASTRPVIMLNKAGSISALSELTTGGVLTRGFRRSTASDMA